MAKSMETLSSLGPEEKENPADIAYWCRFPY